MCPASAGGEEEEALMAELDALVSGSQDWPCAGCTSPALVGCAPQMTVLGIPGSAASAR